MSSAPPRRSLAMVFRRAIACYWLAYYPILAFENLPGFGWIGEAYDAVWARIVVLVGRALWPGHTFEDTSDMLLDSSYAYARAALAAVMAIVAAAALSVLAVRRRASEVESRLTRMDGVVRAIVRLGLANAMLQYGLSKVLLTQFPAPSPERLVVPLLEWSRQTLLWASMGASPLYSVFGGALECLGGVLLLTRRTATLGALITAAAMLNVVALNFGYDVPVKLHSTHLFAMALYVAAPEARRIASVLLGRAAPASSPLLLVTSPRWRRPAALAHAALVIVILVGRGAYARDRSRERGPGAPRPAIYGIWTVDSYTRDGAELAPLLTDPVRWRRIAFDRAPLPNEARATLWAMDERHESFKVALDEGAHALTFTRRGSASPTRLQMERPDADHLVFRGDVDGHATRVTLARAPIEASKLLRPFRWVRESLFRD